ncbi:MAG: sigma-54 dependent transcriptional regulator [Sandaracinaceae bacterium]|nr:sigma-54 dependent transcriptional regulator [Sandaracinaceae bacterium]
MSSPSRARVLVVDDDRAVGMVLTALITQAGHQARFVASAPEALAALASGGVDVMVSDVRMPGMDGMELLAEVQRKHRDVPVILLTAHGTVSLAVEAMKAGATDFLTKPFDRDEVLFTIGKALTGAKAAADKPPEAAPTKDGPIVGSSEAMREAMKRLEKAAPTMATVLLRGESGTGKEVAARELHRLSPRSKGPFVAVHCGALPDNLLESELFGYEKGAFTGATQRKPGRVELANGGTLFLDEIGDVTPAVQVKLLRLLQEREFQRLGATSAEKADVRFVAATHKNLEQMVKEGTFREDLFYRLNVVPVVMPALRERREDIAPLATRFVARLGEANARPRIALSSDAMKALERADWPGNVRELQNFLERVVVFAEGELIGAGEVARELAARPGAGPSSTPTMASSIASTSADATTLEAQRKDAERAAVREALGKAQGNRTLAARLLGVSRRTLYNKLDELGINDA